MTGSPTTDGRVDALELYRKGGDWLGRARSYLQRKAKGGEYLTWGSDEPVEWLTVRDIELMAAEIAAAAINDDRKYRRDVR